MCRERKLLMPLYSSGILLNPLVLGYRDGSTAAVRQAVLVGNRLGRAYLLHLMASTIGCGVGFNMPMVLLNRGEIDNDQFGSITTTPLAVAGIGDLQLKPKNPSLHPRDIWGRYGFGNHRNDSHQHARGWVFG